MASAPITKNSAKNDIYSAYTELLKTHKRFREQVVDVAKEYQDRFGWCTEVNNALSDLGLISTKRVRLVYVVEAQVPDGIDPNDADHYDLLHEILGNLDTDDYDSIEVLTD
jgi:hypothetical protein